MNKKASVIMTIKTAYRDMGAKDRCIADYVLENTKEASRSSITDIANKLNLAESTVFQFTKRLGYSGFKEFKIALLTDAFDPEISIYEKITKDDSDYEIAKKVFDSSIKALEDTKALINEDTITNAADMLINSKNVHFFGLGGSNAVALDTYHKFLRSPIRVNYTMDYHMQLMRASLLKKGDTAFIISHTGKTQEAIHIAELAQNNGANLIVLTSYPLSTLAKMADIVLISTSDEIKYRSESLSSRLSQLTLIDALFVLTQLRNETETNKSLKHIRDAIAITKEDWF